MLARREGRRRTNKAHGSNYVFDGSDDVARIRMRKEALAQGVTGVEVWGCTIACYTSRMLSQGGSAVNGTYLTLNFVPFEEASYDAEDQAYVSAVPSLTTWGAEAWQAGLAFKQVVDKVAATSGPNGLAHDTFGPPPGTGSGSEGAWCTGASTRLPRSRWKSQCQTSGRPRAANNVGLRRKRGPSAAMGGRQWMVQGWQT